MEHIFGNELDLWELLVLLGWGLTIIIVIFHASSTGQNLFIWTIVAIILPGLGMIIYFLFVISYGVEKAGRRARVHEEQHWEFKLTDKGKKKDRLGFFRRFYRC